MKNNAQETEHPSISRERRCFARIGDEKKVGIQEHFILEQTCCIFVLLGGWGSRSIPYLPTTCASVCVRGISSTCSPVLLFLLVLCVFERIMWERVENFTCLRFLIGSFSLKIINLTEKLIKFNDASFGRVLETYRIFSISAKSVDYSSSLNKVFIPVEPSVWCDALPNLLYVKQHNVEGVIL